jgi:hypothetical protein
MIRKYESLGEFYRAYRRGNGVMISLADVDELAEELRAGGNYLVQFWPDDTVTVRETASKYFAQTKYHRKRYSKIKASLDRNLVGRFSAACRVIGVTQAEVLTPLLEETIRRAAKIAVATGNNN